LAEKRGILAKITAFTAFDKNHGFCDFHVSVSTVPNQGLMIGEAAVAGIEQTNGISVADVDLII